QRDDHAHSGESSRHWEIKIVEPAGTANIEVAQRKPERLPDTLSFEEGDKVWVTAPRPNVECRRQRQRIAVKLLITQIPPTRQQRRHHQGSTDRRKHLPPRETPRQPANDQPTIDNGKQR